MGINILAPIPTDFFKSNGSVESRLIHVFPASAKMIPKAVAALDIPVIAGGGICNGKGFLAALAMGADAVLMGTAFMMTRECRIHQNIKDRLLETKETDTALLLTTIMNPIRCIKNKLADECLAIEAVGDCQLDLVLPDVGNHDGCLGADGGCRAARPLPVDDLAVGIVGAV